MIVGTQYQVLDVVGEGAYGIVCSAVHRPSGRKVAIKKIAPFDHSMFCLRTLRELKLLKFLSEAGVSENVCRAPSLPARALCSSRQDHIHSGHHQATVNRSFQGGLPYVMPVHSALGLALTRCKISDPRADGDRHAPCHPNTGLVR